ncbi:MAG: formate dehydrogenase accessory sulfurtransferase FdhD [Desulfobacter sp.]|nr:MAG: formate dehydrogenase accessory sulfurtransferase FdhD [Desulfobacter sp.]
MDTDTPFGEKIPRPITRYREGAFSKEDGFVATEVPVTFMVNGFEAATLMCSPSHLKEFTYGFLFTSGMIQSADEVEEWDCDEKKWRVDVRVKNFADPELLGKRVYTSGCGKGVMYTSVTELASRRPIEIEAQASVQLITNAMGWLAKCSGLHKRTGGVHSAAVCINNEMPQFHIDDIGRHNAVDKVIGALLMEDRGNEDLILLCTGRISSEILHKARRMAIPVLASRGAPTHQSVLLADEMGMTIVGFVRPSNCAVFTHPERITAP